jgi:hypothetical protein
MYFAVNIIKIKIYRTIVLRLVLYGCEAWSLILRKERRLRVFDNRVLRRIFGPKRGEVTGKWSYNKPAGCSTSGALATGVL